MAKDRVTPGQDHVLAVLNAMTYPRGTIKEIARLAGISETNARLTLTRLWNRGLVERDLTGRVFFLGTTEDNGRTSL